MFKSQKKRTEDEICVHHGRDMYIFTIPLIVMLAIGIVAFLFAGLWWISLIGAYPLVYFSFFVYHARGETMTINDDGIHWEIPMHKDLNVSIPWEDVIEIYRDFSCRPSPTYVRFRNGPDVYREKESTEETYRTTFVVQDAKKMNKILAKHGLSIQLHAPK